LELAKELYIGKSINTIWIEMVGLYIHIPFCEKKCDYCDFYSITNKSSLNRYVDCLIREIELFCSKIQQNKLSVQTIFFGGGTPSILPISHLELIVEAIERHFDLSSLKEFTIECNPGTDFVRNLQVYKAIGINRISIGVQSFVPEELNYLGRIHSVEEAIRSIDSALNVFDNVSIDLIFSIPVQTEQTLSRTMEMVKAFDLKHISAYSLIYEEGTKLYKQMIEGKVRPHSEEKDYRFYKLICESLQSLGFEHYEVSNFAKAGYKCKHNLRYWKGEEYIGFGPSAHSYFLGQRYWNFRSLSRYFEQVERGLLPIEGKEMLTEKEKLTEQIMLGLRAEGLNFDDFRAKFGIDLFRTAGSIFELWQASGKAKLNSEKVSLTDDGYFVCDKLTIDLLGRIENIASKKFSSMQVQL